MSRCGECILGSFKKGDFYCEENLGEEQCIWRLQEALSELAEDRPQGKWVETVYAVWVAEEEETHEPIRRKISTIKCSNCGQPSPYQRRWITCPYCEAKMEGENK